MTPFKNLLLLPALAISAQGAVVYDLNTAALDGSAGENTYLVSNMSGSALSLGSGSLGFTVGTASGTTNTSYIVGYFGAQSLTNVGDKITLSLAFSGSRNPSNQVLRIGLFDANSSQLSGNVASNGSSTLSAYTGYAGTYGANTTPTTDNEFKQRTASNNNLFTSGAYTPFSGAGEPDFSASLGASGSVTMTFSIEKLSATSVRLETSYGGNTYSVIDSIGIVSSFSAFAIYAEKPSSLTTGPTLSFTDISVITSSASQIPEPSSFALVAGATALGAISLRRRVRR